ncbi:MAG: SUMF1/EgtB/PvdO family nonheme iron enzyme [Isosphaerales bacterium]
MTWPAIAAASLFGFIALSIIIYVTTDKGRIKIVVDEKTGDIQVEHKPGGGSTSTAKEAEPSSPSRDARGDEPAPGRAGWVSLFNGKDLTGWVVDGGDENAWQAKSGELVVHGAEKDSGGGKGQGYLLTERDYADFHLRFQFQRSSDTATSGIALRAVPHETGGNSNPADPPFHLTVWLGKFSPWYRQFMNLEDDETGALWWSFEASVQPILLPDHLAEVKPIGEWNDMEVEMRGQSLRIAVNGREVLNVMLNKTRPAKFPAPGLNRYSGRIGFLKRTGEVRFRKIEIKEPVPSRAKDVPANSPADPGSPASGATGGLPKSDVESRTRAPLGKPSIPPATKPLKAVTNTLGMKLTLIPAGEFTMGSADGDKEAGDWEKPQHRVRITRSFYRDVTEVTRSQFRSFIVDEGYRTEAEKDGKGGGGWNEETKKLEQNPRYTWQNPGFEQTDEHPVVNVSWNDAQAFIAWLSRKEGKSYRLPTEAEWEYACRAGTTSRYSCGDDPEGLAAVGNVADGTAKEKHPDWYWAMAARDGFVYTAPAGRFQPNSFGLCDMHGNVWEWCSDGYDANFYKRSPQHDPPGASGASLRVIRGGSWFNVPRSCRSADRPGWFAPVGRSHDLGFRLALGQSGH